MADYTVSISQNEYTAAQLEQLHTQMNARALRRRRIRQTVLVAWEAALLSAFSPAVVPPAALPSAEAVLSPEQAVSTDAAMAAARIDAVILFFMLVFSSFFHNTAYLSM